MREETLQDPIVGVSKRGAFKFVNDNFYVSCLDGTSLEEFGFVSVSSMTEIIMRVSRGKSDCYGQNGQIVAPYAYLKQTATKENITSLFKSWGLADHLVLIISGKPAELDCSWVEFVFSIPRMAKEYDGQIVCFIVGDVLADALDYTQTGVQVVHVIPSVDHIDFEGDINVFEMSKGEKCSNTSRCTHYLFSEMSDSDIEAMICDDRPSVSILGDKNTVSITCKLDNSKTVFTCPITKMDSQVKLFLTIIGAFPVKIQDIIGVNITQGHKDILQIGTILSDSKLNCLDQLPNYFVQEGTSTVLPPLVSRWLPQGNSLVIISLNNQQTNMKNVHDLMVRINEEISGIIFLLVDPHALLLAKRLLSEEQNIEKVKEIAKRTVAITSVRAVKEAGIHWDISANQRCKVQTFPAPSRNSYVGIFHISYEEIEGATIDLYLSKMLNSEASQVMRILFVEDEEACSIVHSNTDDTGEYITMEYKSHIIPTSMCLADMILSSLIPEYITFHDAPALVKIMDKWDVTSSKYFKDSTLMKMARFMISRISDQPDETTHTTLDSNRRSSRAAHQVHPYKVWVPCIIKQLIAVKEKLQSADVVSLVSSAILTYIRIKTSENSSIPLKHPRACFKPTYKYKEQTYDKLIAEILKSSDAFWNIGIILCHQGRTTELRTYFTFSHNSLVSYLLYSVGVLKHEMDQSLGEGMAYQNREAHLRISDCVTDLEELAKDIVQNSFEIDERLSTTLFKSEAKDITGNVLSLALMIKAKPFLSSPACRKSIYAIWWSGHARTSWIKILLLVCVPFYQLCYQADIKNGSDPNVCEDNCKTIDSYESTSNLTKSFKPSFSNCIYKVPAVKCLFHFFSYIGFLVAFILMVLTGLEKAIDPIEYVVLVWVVSLVAQETKQIKSIVARNPNSGTITALWKFYITDFWNVLDNLMFFFYFLAFSFRLTAYFMQFPSLLNASQILFTLDVLILFIKFLQFSSVHKEIGPLLIMVTHMCKDMVHFMIILLVTLLGYGVALQSVLHPHTTLSGSAVFRIFQIPYQQLYGEIDIDDILTVTNSSDVVGHESQPGFRNYVGVILADCYLLFTNVLLLSLLIAMFNSSYEKVKAHAQYHNVIHMYGILLEYQDKSFVAPPFTLLVYIYNGLVCLRNYCRRNKVRDNNSSRDIPASQVRTDTVDVYNNKQLNRLLKVITASVNKYSARLHPPAESVGPIAQGANTGLNISSSTVEKIGVLSDNMDTISDNHTRGMKEMKEQMKRHEILLEKAVGKNVNGEITTRAKKHKVSRKSKPKRQHMMNAILEILEVLQERSLEKRVEGSEDICA